MNWDQEKCLQLIDQYEKYPVLWNPKYGLYYNKIKKHDAWVKISDAIVFSTVDTKKKMESLLASFRREKAKGKESMGTGKGTQEVYISKWFAFPRLGFLLDRDGPRITINSLEERQEEVSREELDQNQSQNTNEIPRETQTDAREEVEHITSNTVEGNIKQQNSEKSQTLKINRSTINKPLKRNMADQEVSKIDEAFNILKSVADRAKSQDIYDSCTYYGKHVANKLRKCSERARCVAQYHINNILFQADMGKYDVNNMPSIIIWRICILTIGII